MKYWQRYWNRRWDLKPEREKPEETAEELDSGKEQLPPTTARQILEQPARSSNIHLRHRAAQTLQGTVGNQGLVPPGEGQPLSPAMRDRLSATLGTDLASVRLHYSEAANQALNARAFTVGEHIVLRQPSDATDPTLLGHEVAHIVQTRQRGTQAGNSQPDSATEREAEVAGQAIATGEPVAITQAGGPVPTLQRQEATAGMPSPANPLILRESVRAVLLLHYQKQGGEGPFTLTPALTSELQRLIPDLSRDDLVLLWTPEPAGPMEALQRLVEAGYLPLVAAEPKPTPEAEE